MDFIISVVEASAIALVVAITINYLTAIWISPLVTESRQRTFATLCLYTISVGLVTIVSIDTGSSLAEAFAFSAVIYIVVLSYRKQEPYVMLIGAAVAIATYIVAQAAATGNIPLTMIMVTIGVIAAIIMTVAWLILRPQLHRS